MRAPNPVAREVARVGYACQDSLYGFARAVGHRLRRRYADNQVARELSKAGPDEAVLDALCSYLGITDQHRRLAARRPAIMDLLGARHELWVELRAAVQWLGHDTTSDVNAFLEANVEATLAAVYAFLLATLRFRIAPDRLIEWPSSIRQWWKAREPLFVFALELRKAGLDLIGRYAEPPDAPVPGAFHELGAAIVPVLKKGPIPGMTPGLRKL